jgi:hypothetical protein
MSSAARCERCRRFKRPDGLLFCPACGSTGSSSQMVNIAAPTVHATVAIGADVAQTAPPDLGSSVVRAVVKNGGKALSVTRRDGRLYRNRRRLELQTLVIDQMRNYERHSWYHAESGEDHVKSGRLDDPNMHGSASSTRVRKVVRPPER